MLRRLFIAILILLTMSPLMLAQTGAANAEPGVLEYFLSVPGLAALALIITEFLKVQLNLSGTINQYLAWVIALVISGAGYLLQLGIFIGVDWYFIFIYGLAAGLIANGLFDWNIVQAILNLLFGFLKKNNG